MADVIPIECELPGAEYAFQDVTSLFLEASAEEKTVELEPDNLLFMENFTLQDAMSALEIGEPRLDSGLVVQEQLRPPFDPLKPLLPEEVCWILDKALAFELEFHAGNFLAHTVHTLLYVHHIRDIDPDVLVRNTANVDPARPIELITIVLRSAVQGLLKCCDLTWRELARGGMYDVQDWQSDKCEVSLLEGMPTHHIITKLDDSIIWLLESSCNAHNVEKRAQSSIASSKVMSTIPSQDRFEFQRLLLLARDHLHTVKSNPSPDCEPGSPAQLAFDPYIGRRLQTATPIRIVTPPSIEDTYKSLYRLLDGLYEVGLLETFDQITAWEIVGNLKSWLAQPPPTTPYVRSLLQTTFYDGVLILNKYSFEWMINRFFFETVGVKYDAIKSLVTIRWKGTEAETFFKKAERTLKRRHFMKLLIEWHALYDILLQIRDNTDLEGLPRGHILNHLPDAALLWRLSDIREIVFSGFQMELYAKEEKSFAYWYAAQVIDKHLACLDDLLPVVDDGSSVHNEMLFQIQFLTALQSLCTASFVVSLPLTSFDWTRTKPTFFRRYKWAFKLEYEVFSSVPVAQPELHEFIRTCAHILQNGNPVPVEPVHLAKSILTDLVKSNNVGGWAGLWARERVQLIQNLLSVCDNLAGLPSTAEEMEDFRPMNLKWDPEYHPWFPSLSQPQQPHSGKVNGNGFCMKDPES
ncbi:N-alpha-acetyltransferase 35, NatC auxiliary subunit [Psilocybe cubensis]|uniref:N-alpha-acetyltransferase 35, NatC auxiliary subunit n=1 Tax=Psilocybe cubensis TaxID=181762 RepID=A0ACB8H6Z9_PSICU|nr:N-alpha-acetyltransferase 35, NatC auxiliary subunit [Psilocybe cubensis]KAH9483568.1 N-alpha-acetyltransferase 35, NatC auxiliary subunit [Psilocybe cubensis]